MDHPRVCGEQLALWAWYKRPKGSPPRMRGTECFGFACLVDCRITPAYAGNSLPPKTTATSCQDHPRVCGEQYAPCASSMPGAGSPPRMRGTACQVLFQSALTRITPAYAGNRTSSRSSKYAFKDHPRVCGEQTPPRCTRKTQIGSPPRMRGTARSFGDKNIRNRITPAFAGNRGVVISAHP